MKLALVQSAVREQAKENLHHIKHIFELLPQDIDVVVLPEMFITPYENRYFMQNSVTVNDDRFKFIADLAKDNGVYLIAGSVPEKENDDLYNTTFVFDPKGNLIARYRKIHRFSITYPSGETYDEADVISAGEDIVTIDTPFGKIGLMICFDVRYPYLASKLQEAGSDIIVVPAAFNQFTGPLHWDVTFRARAIDNQLFMAACSPAKESFGDYDVYGHSLIVNPLGQIIERLDDYEDVLIVDLDFATINETREKLPIIKNKITV
ncbi:MAG: carbon-nitrogen hydrolase family protein [Candidatus Izimaplasma sp.]|nr:carbon-nitrogen hydrolase family protein [Candidatus Izimaplasma bacterium]